MTAAVANFLVNEARRNFHEPANLLQEQDLMIYNFCPTYTGKVSSPAKVVTCIVLKTRGSMMVFVRRGMLCALSAFLRCRNLLFIMIHIGNIVDF